MTFQEWLNDADMPQKIDGVWVDLETGIPFGGFKSSQNKYKPSEKAMDARKVAKLFGGKALAGTSKQKEWAEKIRAEKIAYMSEEHAVLACNPNGLGSHSKFWIESRAKQASEIANFFELQSGLLAQAKALRAAGKSEEYALIAAQYNELTKQWGFN